MALKNGNRGRIIRWGAGAATAGLLIFTSGVAAWGDDHSVVAPNEASVLWVDVEGTGLGSDQVTGEIVSGDIVKSLDFRVSPSGLTAVLEGFPKEFELKLKASEKASARVAMTFATAEENIVSEENSIVELSLFDKNEDQDPPAETEPTPDTSNPDDSQNDDDKSSPTPTPTESGSNTPGTDNGGNGKDNGDGSNAANTDPDDREKSSTTAVTGASVAWVAGVAGVFLAAGIGMLVIRKRGTHTNG